jgi:YegS/Rv2252/BmrU family lipid kinase
MTVFLSSRAKLIYNPIAGFWDWGSVVQRVAKFWEQQGWDIVVEATTQPEHATELARAAANDGCGLVLAAGGDGTLNEVINGLVHSETVLATLPVGTSNSFARELGLPRPNLLNPQWLLDVSASLVRGRVQRVDIGENHSGRHWMLWASTGFDGYVVSHIEPRPRWFKRLGPAGYFAKALSIVPRFTGIHAVVSVDGRTFDGDFLLVNVSNCRTFAGGEVRLNSDGVLDDGAFEIWLFRGRHWPELLGYAVDVTLENHFRNPQVENIRGRHVTVESDPSMDYHLDGEPVGLTPFACELEPLALRLLVPEAAPLDLFSVPGEQYAM